MVEGEREGVGVSEGWGVVWVTMTGLYYFLYRYRNEKGNEKKMLMMM